MYPNSHFPHVLDVEVFGGPPQGLVLHGEMSLPLPT